MPRKDDKDEFGGEEFEDFREEFNEDGDDAVAEDETAEANDESTEDEEEKPAPKKRTRRRKKKEEPVAETDDDADEEAEAGDDESEVEAEAEPEPEPEPEPEILEPDHPDTIAALEDIGARLELNDRGNVWRVFFYEKHGDHELEQIHGLPSLKELWLLGTKVSKGGAEAIGERLPHAKVFYG